MPSFTAAAIRSQLAETGHASESYLFATKIGSPLSVSNVERLLRAFVDDNEQALNDARVEVGEFTTHIFRRTAATLIEAVAGITLASRLFGHSNEQVTRASYVVTAEMVDPITAQIISWKRGNRYCLSGFRAGALALDSGPRSLRRWSLTDVALLFAASRN